MDSSDSSLVWHLLTFWGQYGSLAFSIHVLADENIFLWNEIEWLKLLIFLWYKWHTHKDTIHFQQCTNKIFNKNLIQRKKLSTKITNASQQYANSISVSTWFFHTVWNPVMTNLADVCKFAGSPPWHIGVFPKWDGTSSDFRKSNKSLKREFGSI